MKSRPTSFVIVLALACLLIVACDTGLVSDPNFHTWDGEHLTAWTLDSGQYQRAPTWHPDDFGVELLDSTDATHDTRISQHINATPKCLDFSTLADVASSAQVSVGVDFDDDGTPDYESQITATGFTEQPTQITAPPSYTNFRLYIVKRGTGRAVLAQLDVTEGTDCTAAPVVLQKQALGTACSAGGAECKSGVCCQGICAECCTTGFTQASDTGPVGLGACAAGQTCGVIPLTTLNSLGIALNPEPGGIPMQCDAMKRKRGSGAECLLNGDCTSGHCLGGVWNMTNYNHKGATCPAPPAPSPDCLVDSVRAGACE